MLTILAQERKPNFFVCFVIFFGPDRPFYGLIFLLFSGISLPLGGVLEFGGGLGLRLFLLGAGLLAMIDLSQQLERRVRVVVLALLATLEGWLLFALLCRLINPNLEFVEAPPADDA